MCKTLFFRIYGTSLLGIYIKLSYDYLNERVRPGVPASIRFAPCTRESSPATQVRPPSDPNYTLPPRAHSKGPQKSVAK